jgi:hypothetical protein
MNDDQLRAALQEEYLHVQKTIQDFDARALTIKAWSVTFAFVALIAAFTSHKVLPFAVAGISAAVFWSLEVQWKRFQIAHYARAQRIEAHFRGECKIESPFQISASWFHAWDARRSTGLSKIATAPHVALPHLLIILASGAFLALSLARLIEP